MHNEGYCYKLVDLAQGSPEWYEFRNGKIGASMAAAIMGVSPWQTPLQLWEEICLGKSRAPTPAMMRGTLMEKNALEWVRNKYKVDYRPAVIQSTKYEWFIASLDGWQDYTDEFPKILEIKCPGPDSHLKALEGNVPENYFPQLQHQMAVSGAPSCLYFSYDGETGVAIVVKRDEEYIKTLISKETAFFCSTIDFTPPNAQDKDVVDLDDSEAFTKAERYVQLDRLVEELQKEQETIREYLISKAPHSKVRIGELKISKVSRKGAIDYSKIKELSVVDLEAYRKKNSESWLFTY